MCRRERWYQMKEALHRSTALQRSHFFITASASHGGITPTFTLPSSTRHSSSGGHHVRIISRIGSLDPDPQHSDH